MRVEKNYKVAGRKFEIFFEKDEYVFCVKRLSGSRNITLDTLYTIAKDNLILTFPDYHLDGYQVRNIVYEYLKNNVPGYSIPGSTSKFTYDIDKSVIKVIYEQITRKYIKRRSSKYHFKIDTNNLTVLEFKKM